jgi:hypothetical protein
VKLLAAAIKQAHGSLSLAPSSAAREILARAESRVWEIEKEEEKLSLENSGTVGP